LHRARALERVAAVDDPDRRFVAEALDIYLPRALYALITLINKLDGLPPSDTNRRLLSALLLSACDQANTLWAYPVARARPRLLATPPRFRENNIWLALERAVEQWAQDTPAVPLTIWPARPPESGGICIFEGRLKDLVENLPAEPIQAVAAPLPRPNQAFWTLSALWAGWLWGTTAVKPFKTVLRRRRYDWSWHTSALHAALESLRPHLETNTPIFGLIGEAEASFLSASVIAADYAQYTLEGIALRAADKQAQIHWTFMSHPAKSPAGTANDPVEAINQAARAYLLARGEPAVYLEIHSAALAHLARNHLLRPLTTEAHLPPGRAYSQLHQLFEQAFTYRGGWLRYGGSEKSLEAGHWWLRELPGEKKWEHPPALADRVEMALVNYLLKNPGASPQQIDRALCQQFPGLLTPSRELLQAILESYGEQDPPGSGLWRLQDKDQPHSRREDIAAIRAALSALGAHLGYRTSNGHPLLWLADGEQPAYVFYVLASCVFGDTILQCPYPPQKCVIVLPGGRANLALFKTRANPRLQRAIAAGWRFVKFRHIHHLRATPLLRRQNFDEHLLGDPLKEDTLQLRFF